MLAFKPSLSASGSCFLTLFGVILVPEIMPSHAVWIAPCFWHAFLLYTASSDVFCALRVLRNALLAFTPSFSFSASLAFSAFWRHPWPLKSRPAMQSETCLAFATRSASLLLHLLFVGALRAFPLYRAGI